MPSSRAPSAAPDAGVDTEIDTPTRSGDDSSGSGPGSDEEDQQTEWLATTRTKRSTAGNRLSSLIQQAAAEDDDLELLFAEDEDDVGFEDVEEDASDVQMDSSDDDDDQGPTAGAEELEGEKELERQARTERLAKKRKANDGIPAAFRKRAKIDPTASPKGTLAAQKKKAERASWMPSPEELPTRASARSTTKESKEILYAHMLHRETRRLQQLEVMQKAHKRREAAKPKALTQKDRLAEAARVEEENANSLNTWEEAEKKREEEQRAKLEALQNRKLQGPYITWWSGMAEWVGGKLKRVGKKVVVEEKQKLTAGRKRKIDEMQERVSSSTAEASQPAAATANADSSHTPASSSQPATSATEATAEAPTTVQETASTTAPEAAPTNTPAPESSIEMPSKDTSSADNLGTEPADLTSVVVQKEQAGTPQPPQTAVNIVLDGSAPLPGFQNDVQTTLPNQPTTNPSPPRLVPSQTTPFTFTPAQSLPTADQPPVIERGTWNCLILENFNETAVKIKDTQCQILFNKKFPKLQKPGHPVLCAITNYPAKFRDPSTNLPYCNSYAYKEIQKLKRGEYKWSTLLQAYVGQTQYAARGVPPRFIKSAPPPPPAAAVDTRSRPQGVR